MCILYILNIYRMTGWRYGMTILIDNKSGAPIYDQIYSQIKAQIISGALKEDDALPSIPEPRKGSAYQRHYYKTGV